MRAWPTPFMESGTRQPGELLAHAGVAEMASHMYEVLLPYLATAEPCHLTFAGASFGTAVIMHFGFYTLAIMNPHAPQTNAFYLVRNP